MHTYFNRNMPQISTVSHEARLLSSGTIASLINCNEYATIEAVQNEFIAFVDANCQDCDHWQEAWQNFEMAMI